MSESSIGPVVAIALRTKRNGPMAEVEVVEAVANGGLKGDLPSPSERGITLISKQQWAQVNDELKAELPWHTRRANVLVDAPSLGHLIGQSIEVGDVRVQVRDETHPCSLMEQLHTGLHAALKPDCRAGVIGQIVQGGTIRVGDVVKVASIESRT